MTKEAMEQLLRTKPYCKPEIKKQKGMLFTKQIWHEYELAVGLLSGGCRQCTNCHSCR